MYVIGNYSSGSSHIVQRFDPAFGTVLGRFSFAPSDHDGELEYDYFPTGVLAASDGTIWVLGSGTDTVLSQFSATGEELARYPIPVAPELAGLVRLNGGTFAMLRTGDDSEIITFDPATGATTSTAVVGAPSGLTAFQLNLTPDGLLLWAGYTGIYTVAPDGTGLAFYPQEGLVQGTIGGDGKLYTTKSTGEVTVRALEALDGPGTVIAQEYDPVVYSPVAPMSTTGVTADATGEVYVLGYFYGDPTQTPAIDPFLGITSLHQIHSPTIGGGSDYTALLCKDFTSTALTATGIPDPSWFSVVEGALPTGLTLDGATGVISGTPIDTGAFTASVRAHNGVQPQPGTTADTIALSITITGQTFTAGQITIAGTPQVGETLTADAGTWMPTPDTLGYQWLRNGDPIAGATEPTYQVTASDAGTNLTVTVHATSACAVDAAAASQPIAIDKTGLPAGGADGPSTTAVGPENTAAGLAITGLELPWIALATGNVLLAAGGLLALRRRITK